MKHVLKAALVAAPLAFAGTAADADTFVRMVSGPAGGSWYPLGAKIMQVLGDEVPGISTSNTSGGGISNVKAVDGGDAEIGWSYAHTSYNGFAGRGKFTKKHENVRHFATLYPATFQVAVRADSPIKTFDDMKAANVSPGKAGWTGTAFAESILKAYGFDFAKIKENGGTVHYVSYTESVALMKDGHVDVFMAATSVPQASFIELQHSPGIRFIGLSDDKMKQILNDNPGFITGSIPKAAYEGLSSDIPSLGIVTNMVVSKDLPDETVYQMCKSFWKNHAAFAEVKKVWNRVKVENALNGAAIPVHPGAQKCYDELGVKTGS
ncbi:TAXI family TRAP transporter solute-binding subunit [Nisaea nitritireducens]|uniref:TAXI family TRAP transporter solute-binding subunit n=1 Tax=Nisaea nitritireducens TaxID=568392 RepID=UPI0018664D8A|nr:TAXI family TRAP transporter solute-binding subunit [Nisaea nitritireducens]